MFLWFFPSCLKQLWLILHSFVSLETTPSVFCVAQKAAFLAREMRVGHVAGGHCWILGKVEKSQMKQPLQYKYYLKQPMCM